MFAIIMAFASWGQTKAATKKAPTSAKPTPTVSTEVVESKEEIIKKKAEKWFKDFFVDLTFKDKYSYKPLETKAFPVSTEKGILNEIDDIKVIIDHLSNGIQKEEAKYAEYKKNSDELALKMKTEKKKQKLENLQNEYAKSKENELKYGEYVENDKKKVTNHLENVKIKMQKLSSLSDLEKKSAAYYWITHDCHANNSYGGQVLGVYRFKFDAAKESGYDVAKIND